jgi:hypothetical protein
MPVSGGCRLDRPMRDLIGNAGLEIGPLQQYYLKRVPRFVGYLTEGLARKSG